jgi:hypothetical protein
MKPVDTLFERATLAIARRLVPQGWRGHDNAPTNLRDLVAAWDNCKRIGGPIIVSDLHCERTVFSSPAVNMAFRAWHDHRHITSSAEFDDAGERMVHLAMQLDLAGWVSAYGRQGGDFSRVFALLDCENIGQLEYWKVYGSPPDDQRTFALGYLAARNLLNEGK